jgi:hypothetical protein
MLTDLWDRFLKAFQSELNMCKQTRFEDAWKSKTDRTYFYITDILPAVSKGLGLTPVFELFKVDAALAIVGPKGTKVPQIWVESENDAFNSSHEIRKLCSLCAPLKVLITCSEWDESPGVWTHGGSRTKLLNEWKAIITDHASVWSQPTLIGVIVGEWTNQKRIRFYSLTFTQNGDVMNEHVFFEKVFL